MTKEKIEAIEKDVEEMANIYIQLDAKFGEQDMKAGPTSEDIQKMAVSLYIHRGDVRARESRMSAPAATVPAAKTDNLPKRTCPQCKTVITVQYGKESGKPYYKCLKCEPNVWVNDDGSVSECKPMRKKQ